MTQRIGINGFGRIGRTIARILAEESELELVAINDAVNDIHNLTYLWNYDSTYGRLNPLACVDQQAQCIQHQGQEIRFLSQPDMSQVPWDELGVDIVIEASGVSQNALIARQMSLQQDVRVILTHASSDDVDRFVIMGINDTEISSSDRVFSSNICDANAVAHPLAALDQEYGIAGGFISTMHPWLSYQNLVDAPLKSQSNPTHNWRDYSLGRGSVGSLIPKNTTLVDALEKVLPDIAQKINGFSYRVPTQIVSSADMTIQLQRPADVDEVKSYLMTYFAQSDYVKMNHDSLISVDYLAEPYSVIIDFQWLAINNSNLLKMITWYDNEWGYSSRVADLCRLIGKEQ